MAITKPYWPLSAMALAFILAGCGGSSSNPDSNVGANGNGNGDNTEDADDREEQNGSSESGPSFTNVTVHDPSVIKVEDEYYVFGSHLAGAKTSDLMNWQSVASEVNAANPLFDNVLEELEEALEWSETDTLWAMDIIQLEDGRYYMYYNACRGDSPLSAMGVAVADDIEGPYENIELFLRSGNKDSSGEPGYLHPNYNANIHPNAVDPHVYYDQTGNLWMMYGSYSGGLFVLQMDPDTGLPLPDQGYGEHVMGGNHSRIEAAYVLYSPQSEYYYLFTSFGGLDADGAYNMRVARSESPDGPFLDAMGNDMADVKSDPERELFDDESIEDGAMKLMGNFQFAGGDGYVSPGHNSAYYDQESGEHLIFFHTRFPGRGEEHEVRVHEMFINANDWPVIAPHRYAPLSESEQELSGTIEESDVPGRYQLINHEKDISAEIKSAIEVELESDGLITGEASGSWYLGDDNRVTIELDQEGAFEGVAARLWSRSENSFVVTFSALSDEGVSIWGSRMQD